jgi:hypothetical protein
MLLTGYTNGTSDLFILLAGAVIHAHLRWVYPSIFQRLSVNLKHDVDGSSRRN